MPRGPSWARGPRAQYYGAESSPDCLSQDPARQHRAEIDRDQGTPPARAGNETDLTTCSIMEVTRESEERFVTDQATYTLAGPPELRWGNSKGVSASRESEYSVHLNVDREVRSQLCGAVL
jgi:hypothetical protein